MKKVITCGVQTLSSTASQWPPRIVGLWRETLPIKVNGHFVIPTDSCNKKYSKTKIVATSYDYGPAHVDKR